MPAEPLIVWSHVLSGWVEFAGSFLATGAVGFLLLVLPAARRRLAATGQSLADLEPGMTRAASLLGVVGALIGAWHFAGATAELAARRHTTASALLSSQPATGVWAACVVLMLAGLLLLVLRVRQGLWVAAAGTFLLPLRPLLAGRWLGLLKPFHLLAGGLWLGTLCVMLVAGLGAVLSARTEPARRGPLTAALVGAFSPMALAMGMLMAALGVVMAALELKPLTLLWTSPYGLALLAKLAIVAVVYAVGALNAFRLKPQLGSEAAARGLSRSARWELALAALVLVATAVLVGMPDPGQH